MSRYTPPAGGSSGSGSGLVPSNNLSDLTNTSTARTNLGLGTAATQNTSAFEAANNLPIASSMMLNKSLNLSDLSSPSTARTNLGLTGMGTYTSVPVASGGTGLTSIAANYLIGGNSGGTGFEAKSLQAGPGITITLSTGSVKWSSINTLSSGNGQPYDLSTSNQFYTIMTSGGYVLSVSNGTVGQVFRIRLMQDSVGNRTPSWWSTIKWPGGTAPTMSIGVGKADWYTFIVTGTNTYDGFTAGQNF